MSIKYIIAQADGQESTGVGSTPVGEETQTLIIVEDANQQGQTQDRPSTPYGQFLFIGLMMVLMYFMIFRGPRKQKQKHRQMVQGLEKNDRIRTIGGILGTVVDIKEDEITLKVDESNNTKIKIVSSAIGKNLTKDKD
jgi:preprotein translocase subunit YajC